MIRTQHYRTGSNDLNNTRSYMNNLQKIASGISGFHPSLEGFDQGTQDDGYYKLTTAYEKLFYLIEYSMNVEGVKAIDREKAKKIFWFLEEQYYNSDDKFYAFRDLK